MHLSELGIPKRRDELISPAHREHTCGSVWVLRNTSDFLGKSSHLGTRPSQKHRSLIIDSRNLRAYHLLAATHTSQFAVVSQSIGKHTSGSSNSWTARLCTRKGLHQC